MRRWMRWSAWLCLFLMLGMATAESTHRHARQTEIASCSICVVAHSASPTVSTSQTAPVLAIIGLLQEEDVIAQVRFDFANAGIRGPPAVL